MDQYAPAGKIGQASPEPAASRAAERTNQEQFRRLLAPVLDAAYGTAFNMTRNRQDTEDVIQEAALRAFRAFHTFREGTNFKAWFFRILVNVFITKYRRTRREPETLSLEDVPALYLYSETRKAGLHERSPDPAALLLRKIDEDTVATAIDALPEEYRVVAVLYFMEEFSYQEIAGIVGCPVGTVRSRLHRGRRVLQKSLWSLAQERGIVSTLQRKGAA